MLRVVVTFHTHSHTTPCRCVAHPTPLAIVQLTTTTKTKTTAKKMMMITAHDDVLHLARDQLVALLVSTVATPHCHCGARSPARVLPAAVIADEIGAKWVMHVDRRAVIRGHSSTTTTTATAASDAATTTYHIVSHTLGVVERGMWCGSGYNCESRAYFNAIVWFWHGGAG
ncbi:hypothetical protein Pelo_19512 [Pelomyxa schiedti]|nr:hypothetical protein Pelo_19512 [Pelomyxa schiedti]